MPTVPFMPKASAPQIDETFVAMVAADLHGAKMLFKETGTYIGDLGNDDDLSYDRTEAIGRRGEDGKVKRTVDPAERMRQLPEGQEGYTLPDNPHLFIRKKRPPKAGGGPEDLIS